MKVNYLFLSFLIIFFTNCNKNNIDSNLNKSNVQQNKNINIFFGDNWKISINTPSEWVLKLDDVKTPQIAEYYKENMNDRNIQYIDIVVLKNYDLGYDDENEELNEYYFIKFINRHIKNMIDNDVQIILQDHIRLNINNNYHIITEDWSSRTDRINHQNLLRAFIEYKNYVIIITLYTENNVETQSYFPKFKELINSIIFINE